MPTAVLHPDRFTDALVGVVDEIRREVHGALGTRPYQVAVVRRTWSGGAVGIGTPAETALELDPAPLVDDNPRGRLGPAGREDDADVVLSEVSLRYSEAELNPPPHPAAEVAYRIRDAHGQGQPDQYLVLQALSVRRGDRAGDGIDWVIKLRRTAPFSADDGASAP